LDVEIIGKDKILSLIIIAYLLLLEEFFVIKLAFALKMRRAFSKWADFGYIYWFAFKHKPLNYGTPKQPDCN
jgi:hypothetical protein